MLDLSLRNKNQGKSFTDCSCLIKTRTSLINPTCLAFSGVTIIADLNRPVSKSSSCQSMVGRAVRVPGTLTGGLLGCNNFPNNIQTLFPFFIALTLC